ncbi:Sec7-domain-containing protein [Neolentinus lepideus HHB14362 ss-1]|uniref:Sec7-domain-containing protein n=1 Tax=Neolentinus lepideus HHB14362 ss-1 TaxID=1314782 RepID=A0A165TD83_9AGAM|nr:Sec7-domain-containing protein [Neolentinus lepideus HHB14362 ss-1]
MQSFRYSPSQGTISKKHILEAEILSVTTAMRKNSRWASSTNTVNARDSTLASTLGLRIPTATPTHSIFERGSRERELMANFQELRREVKDTDDIESIYLSSILAPFFAIIRSQLSTGPITSAALSALHTFFVCGLISVDSPGLDKTLTELSSTVSHCKFDASDSSGDEVVLLKIMMVIQDCMCGSTGNLLGDVEICDMLETVLTTCCQMRLSEILRRSAESTMHQLTRVVFARLHSLDPEEEEAKLLDADNIGPEGDLSMSVTTTLPPADDNVSGTSTRNASETSVNASAVMNNNSQLITYGLPSILELVRVLINILDPNDRLHTDSTRLTALDILNVALEIAGPRICDYPSLSALILSDGCKYLFQLARSDNPSVLHLALRTISTMFNTMRRRMKLQQELFLAFVMDRLAPPVTNKSAASLDPSAKKGSPHPGTPALLSPRLGSEPDREKGSPLPPRLLVNPARGETRELMLEILAQISRHPSFAVDLYTNYDCDINCEDMFERLVDFLTKGVYAVHIQGGFEVPQQNSQYLCLDLLLAFVNHMANRAQGLSEPWPPEFVPREELMQNKSRKKLVMTGAGRFNTKPKTGIAFLEENGLIYADLSPSVSKAESLAKFLKSCTRLDKRLLGDFISRPENIDVLRAFIGLFDFRDKPVVDAMRELLESFRLPGESQQIDRITETFAQIYFASHPAEIKNQDAVYVLAFSIIMLNTDLHNPQVRKRMTIEDYTRNLRGVNDGTDFSPEFIRNIYESIRRQEMVMPEEHTGQLGFEYAWKELLMRARQSGDFFMCNASDFDIEMFKSCWKSIISAIAYAFINFENDHVMERAISGFRQCASLAGYFHLPDVFDYIVVSLSQATSLLYDSLPTQVPNYPTVDVDGQVVTVSSLAVKFGTNLKGQLAAVVLFNIVNGNGNALREGWTQIFEMFASLFLHSLLPVRMLQMEDFLGGVSMIPLRGKQPPRSAPRGEGGLLSALSSYLMTPYGASAEADIPEATDEDVENTLCTIDCITACRLDELYGQIMQLDLEPLIAAIRALEALAHERTVARLKQEFEDVPSPSDHPGSVREGSDTLPYDPASVFLLETMISIARQASQHIEELWPILFEHMSALLSASSQYSVLLIERAVVGLLRLCLLLASKPSLRDQIYVSIDLLGDLPPSVLNSVGEQVVTGLDLIFKRHPDIARSQTEWNLVFALLRKTISHPEAARQSFDFVQRLAIQGATLDNFSCLVTMLDEFCSIASLSAENQRGQEPQGRRPVTTNALNSPVVDRGRQAVDLLAELSKQLPPLLKVAVDPTQEWRRLCLPLLITLGRHSTNASKDIRQNALSQLQRITLGPHILPAGQDGSCVQAIFGEVLFPVLDELLTADVARRDPRGVQETRLRASTLLCKAFMHFEVREGQPIPEVKDVWTRVLDIHERLMKGGWGDQMVEAVTESLKNVVLVMDATGILVRPLSAHGQNEERQALWEITEQKLEHLMPGFLAEIVPEPQVALAQPEPAAPLSPLSQPS